MVSIEAATDDELVAIAAEFPDAFTPEHSDHWHEYFEALEQRHLVEGLEKVLETTSEKRDLFSWFLAPFVSRLDSKLVLDFLDQWSETVPVDTFLHLVHSCSTFATSPRTRRAVFETYGSYLDDVADASRRGIDLQFCESPTEFRREWLHGWVLEYRSSVSYLTRCGLLDFDQNPSESVHIWAHGFPIRLSKPTDELLAGLQSIYEETQSYYENRDEPIELLKGTTFERTIASSAESWTGDERVAQEYDGHSVLERSIPPEMILLSYEVVADRANVYTPQARSTFIADSEYVVFGGGIE